MTESIFTEVVIDSIRVSLMSQQRIVILREKSDDRYLPIWIGPYEAEAITIALQEVEVSRPLTHDLLNNMFRVFDGQLLRVEVTALEEETYYGNLVISINGETVRVDSRPSDAIALAVRAHVPIMVEQAVMENAGIIPDEHLESDILLSRDEKKERERQETQEPIVDDPGSKERLSVFEDFLDNIDVSGGKEDKGDKKDDDEKDEDSKK